MTLTLLSSSTAPLPGQTGTTQVYQLTNPTVGTDWTFTVPAFSQWVLQSVYGNLVSSATAGTRQPLFVVTVSGAITFLAAVQTGQAPATQADYAWSPGVTTVTNGVDSTIGIPAILLNAGTIVKSVTRNLAAGDQWANVAVTVLAYT